MAGRNFRPTRSVIVNAMRPRCPDADRRQRALADKLFPAGDALGKMIYTSGNKTQGSTIIGIVERLQGP